MAEIKQEEQVKKLMKILEGWRMVLLSLKSVLIWEQQWHPCAITGSLSFIYFLIWLMDLNTLTVFAVVGAIINITDFIVPIACNSLYGPNSWTAQNEQTFEDLCRSLVCVYNMIMQQITMFCNLREAKPLMYYMISMSSLCALAWISSAIDNTLLLFILSLSVLLYPGFQSRRIPTMMLGLVKGKALKGE